MPAFVLTKQPTVALLSARAMYKCGSSYATLREKRTTFLVESFFPCENRRDGGEERVGARDLEPRHVMKCCLVL
jgi:hypothetical protein